MSQLNKNCMQKTLIRNAELPRNCAQVHIYSQEDLLRQQRQQQQLKDKSPATKQKSTCASKTTAETNTNLLRVPQINSSAKNVQEIAAIKSFKGLNIQEAKQLMPQTKATLALTKKLNFAPDQVVFKDLVSLNVNDSILLPKTKPNYRNKYKPTDAANRIPVPDLADFLEPLPALEIALPVLPDWEFVYSSDDYDGFAAYKKHFGENHPYTN